MDLAGGAKKVFVMMEHLTKSGESKIVERCSYPLTGARCVNRIYTDLAVIDVKPDGLHVVETVDGLSFEELQRLTGVPLKRSTSARLKKSRPAARPGSAPESRRSPAGSPAAPRRSRRRACHVLSVSVAGS